MIAKRLTTASLMILSILLALSSVTKAQDLCETIVDTALLESERGCANQIGILGCYGFDRLRATFFTDDNNDERPPFNRAGHIIPLETIQTIQSRAISLEDAEWGVAYFQLFTSSNRVEEATRLIIMGDVLVENSPQAPDESDETLVFQTITSENAFIDFYFIAATASECIAAPNTIIVQAPENQNVQIRVNDVTIQVEDTAALGMVVQDEGEAMWVTALGGEVTLNPDTPDAEIIPRSHTVSALIAPLSDALITDANTGEPLTDGFGTFMIRRAPVQAFSAPHTLDFDSIGYRNWSYYQTFSKISPALLNAPIIVERQGVCQLSFRENVRELPAFTSPNGFIVRFLSPSQFTDLTPLNSVTARDGQRWFEVAFNVAGRTTIWLSADNFSNITACDNVGTGILPTLSPDLRAPTVTPTAIPSPHSEPAETELPSIFIEPTETPIPTITPTPTLTPLPLPG